MPVLEEAIRRQQLQGILTSSNSFALRPVELSPSNWDMLFGSMNHSDSVFGTDKTSQRKNYFSVTPLRHTGTVNTRRPYGWGNGAMVPNVGMQTYTQIGFSLKASILRIQFSPEFIWSQNKSYHGFAGDFSPGVNRARYRYWSFGDYPERFGDKPTSFFWWGQSKVTLQAGAFEAGVSTENIWWGPGQFSALTFSGNARSFPHFTLNTRRPAKTFLGSFEGQLIVGRLEDSGIEPAQNQGLNDSYFFPFSGDYKYLNALTIIYQPKWIKGLYFGVARTHQQYSEKKGEKIIDYLPVFEAFQKSKYGFDKDNEGRDQQLTFFGRMMVPKAQAEIYFELGRRDHALNWREAILNPEHARAYLIGFQKLFNFVSSDKIYQVRAEVLNQSESINRIIRYAGLGGGYTWHTHGQARGFTNYGEALGTGPGVGSNVQTLEISQIDGLNKRGILIERLENHKDFYNRAFARNPERLPWVDFSLAVLWDQQWNNLILSGKAQFIKSYNYQWENEGLSTADFPAGYNPLAFYGSVNLIYRIGRTK
ncbi:Capsule assembly protein Wzi [Algoriphagus locisalis]|uniref:Capsule assembly protein Wzi n=2 Tax=Algoriphagus locisalis TaxID=305507 RepID=A0A1I6XNW4_9BACT|nr:Capsule assembly protein Wzi [Algoriphagus locisalis]